MSRLEMRLSAYDCMDQVVISIRVWEVPDAEDIPTSWESLASTTIQGTGETDRRAWVSDALVAALEAL